MRFRHPTFAARAFFAIMLIVFALLGLVAAVEHWWFVVGVAVLMALLFVGSAPFVLGRGWKPTPPRRTRRPVTRRR